MFVQSSKDNNFNVFACDGQCIPQSTISGGGRGHYLVYIGGCHTLCHTDEVWFYFEMLVSRYNAYAGSIRIRHRVIHYGSFQQLCIPYSTSSLRWYRCFADGNLLGHRHTNVDGKQAIQVQRGRLRECSAADLFGRFVHVYVYFTTFGRCQQIKRSKNVNSEVFFYFSDSIQLTYAEFKKLIIAVLKILYNWISDTVRSDHFRKF